MAAQLTRSEIEKLQTDAAAADKRAKSTALRARREAGALVAQIEESTKAVVQTGIVSGTSFAWGLVGGRYGGTEIVGLPGDLAAAIGAHATAMFMESEQVAEYLHNVGDGSFAAYSHTMGLGIGRRWRAEAARALAAPVPAAAIPAAAPAQQVYVQPAPAPAG